MIVNLWCFVFYIHLHLCECLSPLDLADGLLAHKLVTESLSSNVLFNFSQFKLYWYHMLSYMHILYTQLFTEKVWWNSWRKEKLYQAKEVLIATDNLNVIFMSSEIISESQKASLLQLGPSERKLVLHLQSDNEYLLGINYILCKMWPEIIWRWRTEHISSLQTTFETLTYSVCWNMKASCGCVSSGPRGNYEV